MLSKRYRLRNCWGKGTHCDGCGCNPVNEAVFMEIHDGGILSEFCTSSIFGMKKGADAPFPFEIAISSVFPYAAAAFFLPTNLPINGQKRSTKAKDVMPPTNGLEKKISKLPCENNMD